MMKVIFPALIVAMRVSAGPLSAFFSAPAIITATATDASNNLYIAGNTTQGNLPATPGAFLIRFPACPDVSPCQHGFIAKVSSGGKLIFATYLIGMDDGDSVSAIALDASQDIYIAGSATAIATTPAVGFIAELSSDGSKLLANTGITGAQPIAIAIASSRDVFVAGVTTGSGNFSTTTGAFQTTNHGGTDAFVIHFDPALSKPIYATLLGGAGNDLAYGLAVDTEDAAYVTGTTSDMRSFPITPGAVLEYSSAQDVFVVKLNATGTALTFSALFGPNYIATGVGIAVDSSGVYVAGVTLGPNFPLAKNAFLTTGTQFAAKLTSDGSALLYQTLLPGPYSASIVPPFEIGVDGSGNLLILGSADSLVPTTPDSFSPCTSGGTNKFVLQLDSTGTARSYGSYLPGGLAIRPDGQVWYSDASGAVNSFNIHDPLPPGARCVADSLTYLSGAIAPGKLVSLFGPGIGPDQPVDLELDASGKVGIYLGGVSVYFNGIAAPLLYTAQNQINAVVPFEIARAQASTIVILKNGVVLHGPDATVVAVAPVFAITSEGCVAAVNPEGSINSSSYPASLGSVISIFGEGAGLMNPAVTGGIGEGASQIVAPVFAELQESGTGFPGEGFPVIAPVTVLYAGDAAGEVEGVFQSNLKLPDSFSTGKQLIHLTIGGVGSGGTCIWIGPHN
jgi:uncharacterized protein (TIGR03437 family)